MSGFRQVFKPSFGKGNINWYPGHMAKSLRIMHQKLRQIDCIVEVHDARLPLTGRNLLLQELGLKKPRILVLNKADLAEPQYKKAITSHYASQGISVVFTNAAKQKDFHAKTIIADIVKAITRDSPAYLHTNSEYPAPQVPFKILVVGIPNVGKSSLINAWRRIYLNRGKALKTGPMPGVTRAVQTSINVHTNPKVQVIDTPGVMIPHVDSYEEGMQLALIGALKDNLVGEEYVADYLLYWMNKHGRAECVEHPYSLAKYVDRFKLSGPNDNIAEVLHGVAKYTGRLTKGGVADMTAAAGVLLKQFREGELGRYTILNSRQMAALGIGPAQEPREQVAKTSSTPTM